MKAALLVVITFILFSCTRRSDYKVYEAGDYTYYAATDIDSLKLDYMDYRQLWYSKIIWPGTTPITVGGQMMTGFSLQLKAQSTDSGYIALGLKYKGAMVAYDSAVYSPATKTTDCKMIYKLP